ncbi:solute carrier organic anion transporter family member 1c1-like [Limosa lapponica baueri]|uniref:Solute carrier organic anion transporter family member 1c1-like n=1 Tax=Limosa lapponica baueri TaxID=1758121 RepID=A0A2I0U057_LIMLA|nr:solute carrier organic anion transporter family member 1c1-like [Limosa lapponica baueri]
MGQLKVMIEKEYPEYILAFDKEEETLRNMKFPRLMKWYRIESSISPHENFSVMPLCLVNQSLFSLPPEEPSTECEKEPGSLLWIFVMIGNIVRGMGETPIMPLGISYLEDFAKAENSPFYLGVYNLPVICVGYFVGGLFMKKFKINIYQAANIAFWVSLLEYLLYFAAYWTICDTSPVAGLTVSYEGSLKPEEKSFGVGIHGLASRVFGRPTYQIWRRKTMDRPIPAGQLKDKSLFQDSDGSTVPVKSVCHNFSKLKIFLGALAFSFFAKGFSGSYMKSMTSQIERRFEISSSVVGLIDGSFEIGNLMVIVLVSYLGPRVHRPKIIAVGCLIMSLGAFFSVMPQFLMGRYNYERVTVTVDNSSTSVSACSPASSVGHPVTDATETPSAMKSFGLVRSSGMFGPTLGFLLGSFCASLWVDIGVVDIDTISINPKDTRWVGAWWLGLLICGAVNFIASLPFWFLPHSLTKEGENEKLKISHFSVQGEDCKIDSPVQPQIKFSEAVKDFLPALKKMFGNPVFLVYIFLTILQYNSLVGMITFETKFMEQQFNVSVAKAIFLIGVILLPITILGMFLGGFLIKKFKLHITEMTKFACITFIIAYLLNLLYFTCSCEVLQVAGLTAPYSGSVSPDLKSFAVGIETLVGRVLGGLPAPIYFGALIDETCLKWGTKNCGGTGSCRVYDTNAFRNVYLGLIAGLRAGCCLLYIVLCVLIMKRFKPDGKEITNIKNRERSTRKEPDTANKKEILPGAITSEESEETHLHYGQGGLLCPSPAPAVPCRIWQPLA